MTRPVGVASKTSIFSLLCAQHRVNPEQRLPDGQVANDLGYGGVGIEPTPEVYILRSSECFAGEEQARPAGGKVVEVLDVLGVGPFGFGGD